MSAALKKDRPFIRAMRQAPPLSHVDPPVCRNRQYKAPRHLKLTSIATAQRQPSGPHVPTAVAYT
eukprot:scaffold15256_cov126-Isochrysis_galbana.AAC.4